MRRRGSPREAPAAAAHDFTAAAAVGDWPRAATAIAALLKLDPTNPALHYNLGVVRRRGGQTAVAAEAFTAALALAPDHANARFEAAACAMETGDLETARAGFAAYLARVPGDPDAVRNLARVLLKLGRPGEALAHVEGLGDAAAFERAESLRDLGHIGAATALLGGRWRDRPDERASLLKLMTQGTKGRFPLDPKRLG